MIPDEEDDVCEHKWVETVDEDGELVEPPSDTCVQCGLVRY